MSQDDSLPFMHVPVMVDEVVALLAGVPAGVVLDATLGGAGHADALLRAAPQVQLVGLDQDPAALVAAAARLAGWGDRVRIRRARFDGLVAALAEVGVTELAGALFDLGVSSPQLDRPERGFSYRSSGPLDMRMDPDGSQSADDVVNGWTARDLATLFSANGEGRFARRIATAVVAARPLRTTAELADVVRDAIPAPARRRGGHPAKRVFQALRIAVNDELDILPGALDDAMHLLVPGGRCVVLAYHSGEDRIAKDRFREAATGGCACPPGLPCVCGATPSVGLVFRGARRPGEAELAANPRSQSVRLRAVERLAHGPAHPGPGQGSDAR